MVHKKPVGLFLPTPGLQGLISITLFFRAVVTSIRCCYWGKDLLEFYTGKLCSHAYLTNGFNASPDSWGKTGDLNLAKKKTGSLHPSGLL